MRWYFAIDEGGALGETGALAKLAVLSALAVGGLEPVLLYHGQRGEFCAWMERHGVRIIEARPGFWAVMERAQEAGTYRPLTIGHWLRLAIPEIETERDYVLYTDCDVIFLRRHNWESLRPQVFAAAPEMLPENWNYFNSGVMLLHMPAMRATRPALEALVCERVESGDYYRYDDQYALNEAYRGHWEKLALGCNYKPYWDFAPDSALLHWHGPKPAVLAALARGACGLTDDALHFFNQMLTARSGQYLAWSQYLGDFLQGIDFEWALHFARLASALTVWQRANPPTGESAFMNIKYFAE
jgi:hypothetical protein